MTDFSRGTGLNPIVLRWARERAGYSTGEIAKIIKKPEELLLKWEQGSETPTYAQLEKLAYSIYKRPLALFFLPDPPEEDTEKTEFRTLPESEITSFSPDTRYSIREASARRLSLHELLGLDGQQPKTMVESFTNHGAGQIDELAQKIRRFLRIPLEEQTKWRSSEEAFVNWRDALENSGVFVFKRAFKQKSICGFSIYDTLAPLIYVNNANAFTRQSFTLFHELYHLLSRLSGIDLLNDDFVDSISGRARSIEVSCNRFAAEFLVPTSDFESNMISKSYNDQFVLDTAKHYNVSREVILRRMLDLRLISENLYNEKRKEWLLEFRRVRSSKPRGNYYRTQVAYLGAKYLSLAFKQYYRGRLNREELALHLDIKPSSVAGIENEFAKRVAKP